MCFILNFGNENSNVYSQVAASTPKSRSRSGNVSAKHILDLELDDVLIMNTQNIKNLFGINMARVRKVLGGKRILLRDLQNNWINHIKRSLAGFPEVSNGTKYGRCDYRHALFALRGSEFFSSVGSRSYIGSASYYGLVPFKVIGSSFAVDLISHKDGNIFQRHGFSDSFFITPHQLRH